MPFIRGIPTNNNVISVTKITSLGNKIISFRGIKSEFTKTSTNLFEIEIRGKSDL